jgi:hydrogenase maturation protease
MSGPTAPQPAVRVLVCGNAERGDDAVAPAAMAALLPTLAREIADQIEIRLAGELRVEDLVDLPPGVRCLVVDAVAGIAPGEVVHLPLEALGAGPGFTPRSSHQLPIHLVVGLAGVLRDRPVEGTFIGLAGRAFGYGTPISSVVRAALPAFEDAIKGELRELAFGAPRPAAAPAAGAVA